VISTFPSAAFYAYPYLISGTGYESHTTSHYQVLYTFCIEDHDTIVRAINARKTSEKQPACSISDPAKHSQCNQIKVPLYFVSVSSSSPNWARCLATTLSCFLSRAALVFARLASISSFRTLSRAFSALALWIYIWSARETP